MSVQYMVLGFDPMTFEHESLPKPTRPGLPPYGYLPYNHIFLIFGKILNLLGQMFMLMGKFSYLKMAKNGKII